MEITPQESVLLIIDIQEKLSRVMDQDVLEKVVSNINLLATLAEELKIPIILTEQYPEGLGPTIGSIREILKNKKHDFLSKVSFGCCDDGAFNKKLRSLKRKKVILTGMETHVCVYLTALGLMKTGYRPFVVSDAVISRTKFHYKNGLDLLRQSDALVSNTETLLFQLMVNSGTPLFRKISTLLKQTLAD